MIMNEKIKAAEVQLTGIDGEDLGIVPTAEALSMAKKLKVDLVCTSLTSSPPPCRLIGAGAAKQEAQQLRKKERQPKLKEIRLTPQIEEHDYDTKRQQAERILNAGDAVQLVVNIRGKEGEQAKKLLEALIRDLNRAGRKQTGIQLSGKQAAVRLDPL
ncbi:translation initiation factor IF-3 [Paenibacillus piri]|uniref:Translation initiation factor IF-3 n=1 Tax=Paenibacillus piri TaxID=2547395 RepID=A0A4R5KXC5_9BACL|nr:translation initiation factor IF-3 [Paenibacillus piri]TDG00233.1 translation initiation factor IF-3 [Paenibacillus piri]